MPYDTMEGTALLARRLPEVVDDCIVDDVGEDDAGWTTQHPLKQHRLSSEVIRITRLLLQPDFNITNSTSCLYGYDNVDVNHYVDNNNNPGAARISITLLNDNLSSTSRRCRSSSFSIAGINTNTNTATTSDYSNCGNINKMIGTVTTTSVLNLIVATAGGIGMVTLPGSFAQVGYMEGILLLLVAATAASCSLFLLNWSCNSINTIIIQKQKQQKQKQKQQKQNRTQSNSDDNEDETAASNTTSSYASLVAFTLGHYGSNILELLTLTYCLGQVIAYLGAIAGQVSSLLTLINIEVSIHICIAFIALLIMFPLSLLPEESSMRFAGFLGTICMIYIVLAVLLGDGFDAIRQGGGTLCSLDAASVDNGDTSNNNEAMAFSSSFTTLLKNAPVFLFAMNASVTYVPVRYQHQTCLGQLISSSLSTSSSSTPKPTPTTTPTTTLSSTTSIIKKESTTMIITAVSSAGFFYLVCSGVAYFAYCGDVPENVVDVWSLSWIPGLFARGFLAIELIMAAAGIYVPLGRAALWHVCYGPYATVAAKGCTRTIITFILIGIGAIGSIAIGGALALPLAITSALCVTAQMFVLPGLCVNKLLLLLQKKDDNDDNEVDDTSATTSNTIPGGRLTAIGFAVLGMAFGILSLATLFGLLG